MATECKILKYWDVLFEDILKEQADVYFTEAYHRLHETEKDKAECFFYRKGVKLYIFPYLKRENYLGGETFFDFESAYGYGGPVSNSRDIAFLSAAESAFYRSCQQRGFVAGFVRFCPWLDNVKLISDSSRILMDRKTILMDLTPSVEDIWAKQIHAKHRNVIRKAEREGLTFEVDRSFDQLKEFMSIYYDTMQRLKASDFYLFLESYFHQLKETLSGRAFLGLIRYQGKIISAAIFFHQGPCAHYHLSGSLTEYQALAPNNLLLYHTAVYLKNTGARFFHLGGGTNSQADNTLLKFKKRFSPNTRDFCIGKFVFDQKRYDNICQRWAEKNPEKEQEFGRLLLKYRNGEV
jgi:hypothetical protein